MPTYVYECTACSEQTELVHKVSDPPLEACPSCGGMVRRVLFPVGIVFKGSGFHVNDYAKDKGKKEAAEKPASSESAAPKPASEPAPAAS